MRHDLDLGYCSYKGDPTTANNDFGVISLTIFKDCVLYTLIAGLNI